MVISFRRLRPNILLYLTCLAVFLLFADRVKERYFRPTQSISLSAMTEDRVRVALKKLNVKPYLVDMLPSIITYSSIRFNVPWEDIVTTIQVESWFNEYAVGDSIEETTQRAVGLGQMLPSTGEEVAAKLGLPWNGTSTLVNPIFSIQAIAFYIAEEYIIWNSRENMVKAYYIGNGHLREYYRGDKTFYNKMKADTHWGKYSYYYKYISEN